MVALPLLVERHVFQTVILKSIRIFGKLLIKIFKFENLDKLLNDTLSDKLEEILILPAVI